MEQFGVTTRVHQWIEAKDGDAAEKKAAQNLKNAGFEVRTGKRVDIGKEVAKWVEFESYQRCSCCVPNATELSVFIKKLMDRAQDGGYILKGVPEYMWRE